MSGCWSTGGNNDRPASDSQVEELTGYVVAALLSGIVIFILVTSWDKIRLFFASSNERRVLLEKSRQEYLRSKAGMEDYERQVITDLLKDQLTHSREDFSDLQEEVEELRREIRALIDRSVAFEGKVENRVTAQENKIDRVHNRLDNFLSLLSRIDEHTRR